MSFSFIPKYIDQQIFGAWRASREGFALFRIFFSIAGLLIAVPFTQAAWTLRYPEAAISPPPGVMALLPDLMWQSPVVIGLQVVLVCALVAVLVGRWTTASSIVASVSWILVMGIGFSFGKIDHVLPVALVPLLLSRYWGAAWSLDARCGKLPRDAPRWILPFAAWVLSLMMLSAALPKLASGWLDPSTAAVHASMARQQITHERTGLLADVVAGLPWNPLFEVLDWATLVLEGGLVFVALSVYRFRWLLAVALTFHLAVVLTMNIPFVTNVIVYALFAPLPLLAQRAQATQLFGGVAKRLRDTPPVAIAAASLTAFGGVSALLTWVSVGLADDEVLGLPIPLLPPTLFVVLGGAVGAAVLAGRFRTFTDRLGRSGGTLIYDSDCGFCTRYALWVDNRMRGGSIRSWQQSPDLVADNGLTVEDCIEASWWVDDAGPPLRGQHAIAQTLIATGRGWKLLGTLIEVPGISYVGAVVYRFIAANRQLMPGGTEACAVPSRST
jgi:predicted DCC family thiol-disulfide oxidoreductase YuxK